jgi:hypothetical protein
MLVSMYSMDVEIESFESVRVPSKSKRRSQSVA